MLTRKQSWRRAKTPNPRFHDNSDWTETDGYSKNVKSQRQEFKTHNLLPKEIVANPVQLVSNPSVTSADLPLIQQKGPTKSISFCPTVRVCLVPSRNCLSSFADELFWAPDDYKNFKTEAMYEIRAALDARNKSGEKNWSHRDVRDYLYQPSNQTGQCLTSSSSKNLHAQVEKTGLREEEILKVRNIADVSWCQQAVTDMQDIVSKAWGPKRHKQQQDQHQLHPSLSAMRRVDSVQLFKQNNLSGLAGDKKSFEEDMDPYQQPPPMISDPDPSLNRMMRRVDSVQLFKKYANTLINQPQRTEQSEPTESLPVEDFACLDIDDDTDNNNNNNINNTLTGSSKVSSNSNAVPTSRSSGSHCKSNGSGGSGSIGSYNRNNSSSYNGIGNLSNNTSSSSSSSNSDSGSSSSGGSSTSNSNGSTNYCNNCSTTTPTSTTTTTTTTNNNYNNIINNNRGRSEEGRRDSRDNRIIRKLEFSVIPVVLPV